MKNEDQKQKQRRGPKPKPEAELHGHCVSVRLNVAELALVDFARADLQMSRGEFLRVSSMGKLPPTIPEINRDAWSALARSAANLNQVAKHLNEGTEISISEIRNVLDDLRRKLIGVNFGGEDESQD